MDTAEHMLRDAGKIAAVYYEACGLRLTVGFESGCDIVFYEVPPYVAETLLCVQNRCAYFQGSIRDRYPWALQEHAAVG
ncbi:MAG: KTSC domain-containing protein [Dokdonella sp.]